MASSPSTTATIAGVPPEALIARTLSQDPDERDHAWNLLYTHLVETTLKPTLRRCFPSLEDKHEDLIQDCFVEKLMDALPRWVSDGRPRSLERYALVILKNFVRDRLEARQAQFEAAVVSATDEIIELAPQAEDEPPAGEPSTPAQQLDDERLRWMRGELDQLTHPVQRQVVPLWLGVRTPDEVARELGMPAETVRRAIQKVRERLLRAVRKRPDLHPIVSE